VAMISSTSLDLPEHRQQAIDACLRQSVFPIAMEQLPARDADAIRVSLEMVDKADIYIGIFAWRYGYVPEGRDISVTEMEFNRAVERGIPILVFTIHKDHALTIEMVEADKGAQEKLKQLKEHACGGRGRLEFKSPAELRSHIIQSLAALLPTLDTAEESKAKTFNFHPPNLIPAAPAPYIAHPYSLLQTGQVIGRREELKLLTDWVTRNESVPASIRLFNVVAIGGMGKSALTWKWFNEIAPNELPHLAGRMWWSFYESDAYFENFVIRALAYTSGMTETDVRSLPPHEREDRLFHQLDTQPFLLVLDGLERILLAYARMDAAHLDDLDADLGTHASQRAGVASDRRKAEGNSSSISGSGAETAGKDASVPRERHRLRTCSDPRAGRFLRRLTKVSQSRILISTRLYPANLQTNAGQPWPGSDGIELKGLSNDDALALWRAFIGGDRSGTSERLLPCFRAFGNYPLLLRALAGEVAEYHPGPGDFDRWRQDHPAFNPAELDLRNARTHVLGYALEGLQDARTRTLQTLAAFRMPATWETLCAVLIGADDGKPCANQGTLAGVLTELEDRGLVGWDRMANRYDLHPIVRGVVWSDVTDDERRGVHTNLHAHFGATPLIDEDKVSHLEDLMPAIELYHTQIGLGRYEEAYKHFRYGFGAAMFRRLSISRQMIELLESLFPEGVDKSPRLDDREQQTFVLNALALGYKNSGQPAQAAMLFRRHNTIIYIQRQSSDQVSVGLSNLSDVLRFSGKLREAESTVRAALSVNRAQEDRYQEAVSLYLLGLILALRGDVEESDSALRRSLRIFLKQFSKKQTKVVKAFLAQRALWLNNCDDARAFANQAWELAYLWNWEVDFIRAARLQGVAAIGLNDLTTADERLHHALTRARAVNYVEEELPALIALAELRRQQSKPDEARELLDAVWDSAERGPYPLFHADALNVLAQLERDVGNTEKAIAAASAAYRHAWCDGPPYAYHWGLVAARRHLQELGAPEPQLPPFDPTQREPMPEVEINPRDEFYVEVGEDEGTKG
jgi:tetratricopeptide (TPR) repeat protein